MKTRFTTTKARHILMIVAAAAIFMTLTIFSGKIHPIVFIISIIITALGLSVIMTLSNCFTKIHVTYNGLCLKKRGLPPQLIEWEKVEKAVIYYPPGRVWLPAR